MKKVFHGRTTLWRGNDSLSDEAVPRGDLHRRTADEESSPVSQTTVWIVILAILTITLAGGYLLWAKTQQ